VLSFRHYAITDRGTGAAQPRLVDFPPGTLAVQLRDKDLPPDQRRELARALRLSTRAAGHLLFIGGGDVELAREVGADGVHLPAGIVPSAAEGLLVGASCHDAAELAAAAARSVDFVTLGPIHDVPYKGAPMGWPGFASMARDCPVPVFALGGLAPRDLTEAQRHGAWGVAGIRGFLQPAQPG
jgi:8-oxo-dGTP diphosphatase